MKKNLTTWLILFLAISLQAENAPLFSGYHAESSMMITAETGKSMENAPGTEKELIQTWNLSFDVRDNTGTSLTDAVIIFNGQENKAGNYLFAEIQTGEYLYKIIADGYFEKEGTVTVNKNTSLMLTLTPDELQTTVPVQIETNVYPNPARDQLFIESNATIQEIRLIDLLGQVVYSIQLNDNIHEFDVQGFHAGIYFLQVYTANEVITHRIQVTR
ncbi:MAG: T9SS C-terminal target domain-containing protein [Bacteroidia bacterium]|nr:MAG: T9SS C-terminal target domain-containing protein [Bacteroidia bacterium]